MRKKRWTGYVLIIAVLAMLAASSLFLWSRTRNLGMTGAGGEEQRKELTPVEEMREYNVEKTSPVDLSAYRLEIGGLVERSLSLSYEELRSFPSEERVVTLYCVEGWTETGLWKGIRIRDLLGKAGVLQEADNVVFSSPGGYTTSLTLKDIEKTDPLLAYGINGIDLPDSLGFPLRLVVPDKYGYKWIKWVTSIEVIRGEYRGFWESRGYSNQADVK